MKLFAIADVHLGFDSDKPMDVFGKAWDGHSNRLRDHWTQKVAADDIVLMPGDISWAMNLRQARADLAFIDALPGQKIMIRGNHDYWWSTKRKMANFAAEQAFDTLTFLKNDACCVGNYVIAGTRGWILPSDPAFTTEDQRILDREEARLTLSLQAMAERADGHRRIAMLHYPPLGRDGQATRMTRLMETYGMDVCIYGHLHGVATHHAFEGEKNGVLYRLVSADHLGFEPLCLEA